MQARALGRAGEWIGACLLAVVGGALISACASWERQHWLDETYTPGASRSAARTYKHGQSNTLVRTVIFEVDEEQAPEGAAEALGPERLEMVIGFDVYDVRLRTGNRHVRKLESMCDFVFFDERELLVGGFRRDGTCSR